MRIEVTGKHLELTPAVHEYAESKCSKLVRFFNGVMEIDVVLEQARPEQFEVEIRVDVVKHDDFVAKSSGHDIYSCIDQCIDKMTRQLTDYKEKLKNVR